MKKSKKEFLISAFTRTKEILFLPQIYYGLWFSVFFLIQDLFFKLFFNHNFFLLSIVYLSFFWLIFLCIPSKWNQHISYIVYILLSTFICIGGWANLIHINLIHYPFFRDTWGVLLQGTLSESKEFFSVIPLWKTVVFPILIVFSLTLILALPKVLFVSPTRDNTSFLCRAKKYIKIVTLLLCLLWAGDFCVKYNRKVFSVAEWFFKKWTALCPMTRPYAEFFYWYQNGVRTYTRCCKIENASLLNYPAVLEQQEPKTVVVIIGESATRSHHSYFGYERETNPFTKSFQRDIFYFPNIQTCAAGTENVMKKLFFFHKDFDTPLFRISSVLNNYYHTTYIYNNQLGRFSIFRKINMRDNWAVRENIIDAEYGAFDEDIIPLFKKALTENHKRKVIFLHLLGNHMPFENRVPTPKWRIFSSGNKRVDDYDNAIRYTDYVISEILNILNSEKTPVLLCYFSDHGEMPETNTLRSPGIRNTFLMNIPFWIWMNKEYLSQRQDVLSDIKKNQNNQSTLFDFPQYLFYFCGVRVNGIPYNLSPSNISHDIFISRENKNAHLKFSDQPIP